MIDNNFDQLWISETRIHWTYLPDNDRIPQRLLGRFMSNKIDSISACNKNYIL